MNPSGPPPSPSSPSAIPDLSRRVRRLQIRCRHSVESTLAGQYRSVFRGAGLEFEELREYCPGDDVRAMDWSATARLGRPFVKVHREERDLAVWLLVDVSPSMSFATARPSKRETAAELAGLVALSAARNGDRVGALLFSDRVERRLPARKGAPQALRVVREVLACEPEGRGSDLALALRHLATLSRRRSVAFLVSDFAAGGYERALSVAARRHDLILAPLTDPFDGRLPWEGLARVHDLETGESRLLDGAHPATASAWAEYSESRYRAVEAAARSARCDLAAVSTAEGPLRPLLRLFRTRDRGGAR